MLSLTNCTFDGIVYDVERVITSAWLSNRIWSSCGTRRGLPSPAFTRSTGGDRDGRRAPAEQRYRSAQYAAEYAAAQAAGGQHRGWPAADPEKVRIRVYATQSTHKWKCKTLAAAEPSEDLDDKMRLFSRRLRGVPPTPDTIRTFVVDRICDR